MADKERIAVSTDSYGAMIFVPKELLPAFKELIFRGANLWPDAKPEIKDFADVLMHGRPLQDYAGQDTSKHKTSLSAQFEKDQKI